MFNPNNAVTQTKQLITKKNSNMQARKSCDFIYQKVKEKREDRERRPERGGPHVLHLAETDLVPDGQLQREKQA